MVASCSICLATRQNDPGLAQHHRERDRLAADLDGVREERDRLALERVGLTKAVVDLRTERDLLARDLAERQRAVDEYRSKSELLEAEIRRPRGAPTISSTAPVVVGPAPPAVVTTGATPDVPGDRPASERAGWLRRRKAA